MRSLSPWADRDILHKGTMSLRSALPSLPLLWLALASGMGASAQAQIAGPAQAQMAGPGSANSAGDTLVALLTPQLEKMARDGASQVLSQPARIEVKVGQLDPRLKLAPCDKIEPYLPAHQAAWGRTRIGLRCVQGSRLWNVSLPMTVQVWMKAVVTTAALPMGTTLEARHLTLAEVDIAAEPGVALLNPSQALGRSILRTLPAGDTLRQTDFKARQWFAAGENVKVVANGSGWRVVTEGQALSAGIEGLPVKVKVESGRLVQGRAVADREVEVML
ncbi:MAG: flagella basal body P-ring formation protein FlgA [Ideonella sp. MAG2]|nr:MAG: flagella basal body P-ring formation protein FlgA [Ideonella sp. MAG2]